MDAMERVGRTGRMDAGDVAALRADIYATGAITDEGLASLVAVLDAAPDGAKEWRWLVREAFEDYFLHHTPPRDHVSPKGEAMLLEITAPNNRPNRLRTHALVHVLDRCVAAPEALADRAMALIEADVLGDHRICAVDVKDLRHLLHARGSFNGAGICRREADFLFDLNDHVGAKADPAWFDLFSKAIANHLMCGAGWRAPGRADALRQERFMADASVSVGGFMRRMAAVGGLGSLAPLDAIRSLGERDRDCHWRRLNRARAERGAGADAITAEAGEWLASRIARNGRFCDAERAMIAYVRGLAGVDLPAVMEPYLLAA